MNYTNTRMDEMFGTALTNMFGAVQLVGPIAAVHVAIAVGGVANAFAVVALELIGLASCVRSGKV